MENTLDQDCTTRLKQAQDRLNAMSAQTDTWMWETDENHLFNYFTDNLVVLSGLTKADLIGTSRLELALASDDPDWQRHGQDLLNHRPFKNFRYIRNSSEGESRNLNITGWPMFDDNGSFTGYQGTARDETAAIKSGRQQVEKEQSLVAEIEHQRKSLETVLENMNQSVMWFDSEGVIRLNNAQTPKLLGFDPQEYSKVGTLKEHMTLMAQRGDFGDVDIEKEVERRVRRLCAEQQKTLVYRIHLASQDRFLEVALRPLPDGSRILTHSDVTVEAKNDRALREREAVLSTVMSNVDQGILLMDSELNVEVANDKFTRMWGMPSDFFDSPKTYAQIMENNRHGGFNAVNGDDEDDWEAFLAERIEAVRSGDIRNVELSRSDGKTLIFSVVQLPGGRRMATYFDVTELKQREAQLENMQKDLAAREAVLSTVVNNVDQGILLLDDDLSVEIGNDKFAEMWGMTSEFFDQSPTFEDLLVHNRHTGFYPIDGNDDEAWDNYVKERMAGIRAGDVKNVELERGDGKTLILSTTLLPDGRRMATYFDVTTIKQRETQLENMQKDLAAREEVLSTVINNVDQGILLMDDKLNVEIGNDKFADMWGMKTNFFDQSPTFKDIMVHNRHTGFYPVDGNDDEAWDNYVAGRMEGIRSGDVKHVELVRGDGKTLIFSAIRLPGGRRMATYFDVTMLKQREAQLEVMQNDLAQANEMLEERVEIRTRELRQTQDLLVKNERQALLGDLVSSLCHELRNPLNALNTSLFLIRRTVEDTHPKLTRAFDRSERTITRCTNILNDLYDYALVDELKKEVIQVAPWLLDMIDSVDTAQSCDIVIDVDNLLPVCEIDSDQLSSALGKIVTNAAQAITDNLHPTTDPQIQVYAGDCGDQIEIIISDNGPGMDKKTFARALEPLFSTRGFGVGLGLPIAEQIIKRHGGEIKLETMPGAGTTVTIWLPAGDNRLLQAA